MRMNIIICGPKFGPHIETEIAIQVSISIMDAFVEMRKFLSTNVQIFERTGDN